eukprot:439411_1
MAWLTVPGPATYAIHNKKIIKRKRRFKIVFTNVMGEEQECTSWRDLITTTRGYEKFMYFLKTRWETQYLLFATEYIQLVNILCSNQIFIEKFEQFGVNYTNYLPVDQILTIDIPLSTVNEAFANAVASDLLFHEYRNQKTKQMNLSSLLKFVKKYKSKRHGFITFMMHQKYRSDESRLDLFATNHFLKLTSQYYKKYIVYTGPLWIKINKDLKSQLDGMFKRTRKSNIEHNRVEVEERKGVDSVEDWQEFDACIDVLKCYQSVFEDVTNVLDTAFKECVQVLLRKKKKGHSNRQKKIVLKEKKTARDLSASRHMIDESH